jgi:hypothetical protein
MQWAYPFAWMALLVLLASPVFGEPSDAVCPEDSFNVVLKPVCPTGHFDADTMSYFEDARNPILSIEVVRKGPPPAVYAGMMPGLPPSIESHDAGTLLKKADLLSENYFRAAADRHRLQLHYGVGFKVDKDHKVVLTVCNDSNGDGKCSDEPVENQLTTDSVSYTPCHFPKIITVPVWAGCR